jgi:Mn-dependent DtxR family transcriptional regulator
MLRQLLSLLKGGCNHTIGELATALGVNQDLVVVMLTDLAQRGSCHR